MEPAMKKEEVTLAILGECPGIRLVHDLQVTSGTPYAIAATEARDSDEAREFALELQHDLAKGFPAWRGWSIEYPKEGGAHAG